MIVRSTILYIFLMNSVLSTAAISASFEAAGQRFLKSTSGMYLRRAEIDGEWTVDMVPHNMDCEQWYIEERGDKVALRPYCFPSKYQTNQMLEYLCANADGSISFWAKPEMHALWTPLKDVGGLWSFQSVHGTWLSARGGDGRVQAVTHNEKMERFKLETWPATSRNDDSSSNESEQTGKVLPSTPVPAKAIAITALPVVVMGQRVIRSTYNTFLRAWANDTEWFVGMAAQNKDCEQWTFEDHKGKFPVALKAYCSGKYLRGNMEHYVDLSDQLKGWELWTLFKNDDGTWSLQSAHGTWLRAQEHGRAVLQIHRNKEDRFQLEQWTEPTSTSPATTTTNFGKPLKEKTMTSTKSVATDKATSTEAEITIGKSSTSTSSSVPQDIALLKQPNGRNSYATVAIILILLIIFLLFIGAVCQWDKLRRRMNLRRDSSLSHRDLVVEYQGLENNLYSDL